MDNVWFVLNDASSNAIVLDSDWSAFHENFKLAVAGIFLLSQLDGRSNARLGF